MNSMFRVCSQLALHMAVWTGWTEGGWRAGFTEGGWKMDGLLLHFDTLLFTPCCWTTQAHWGCGLVMA